MIFATIAERDGKECATFETRCRYSAIEDREDIAMMKKTALVVGTVATLALAAAQPAEARRGWGPGLVGGLAVGALLAGAAASSAYAYGGPNGYYGPGYGYDGPRYYRPARYGYYGPRYYRPAYSGYYRPAYSGYYRPAYSGYYGGGYRPWRGGYGYGGPVISVGFGGGPGYYGGWGW
jgi:hypothetical protein